MAHALRANADDFSVFVGDLAPEVTDFILQETFKAAFSSVKSAKVITDPATGRSKGYGFVRFGDDAQRESALQKMNGVFLSGRQVRVSVATARRNANAGTPPHPAELDPTNTTLFIGGLAAGVSEEQLRSVFARFGEIVYVKVPVGKGCGFVQYVERNAAEAAMSEMNGTIVGNSAIRISWGRSTSCSAAARGVLGGAGAAAPYAAAAAAAASAGYGAYGAGGYDAAAMFAAAGGAAAFTQQPLAGAYGAGGAVFGAGPSGSGYGIDPSASLAGYAQYGGMAANLAMGGASLQPGAGAAQLQQHTSLAPLSPVDIQTLNLAFIARNTPGLMGNFARMS